MAKNVFVEEIRKAMDIWRGMPAGPEKDRKAAELEKLFLQTLQDLKHIHGKN